MRALDPDDLSTVVGMMGADVPDGFEREAALALGPGSRWAAREQYGGPCPHDGHWGLTCEQCPHDGLCTECGSLFERVVALYLEMTGREAVEAEGKDGEIPF